MGCLLKTLEKGFIRLDKDHPKKKKSKNNQNKGITKNKNKINIKEKNDEIDIKEINNEKINNNKIYNSIIKNKDNYYKPDQLDYYTNIYLANNIQINLREKLNYKK